MKNKKSESGYAVFIAVVLALVLSVIAVTFLMMGYNYYHSSDQYYFDTKGFYAAEAARVLANAQAWTGNYANIVDWPVGDCRVSVNFQNTTTAGQRILNIKADVP